MEEVDQAVVEGARDPEAKVDRWVEWRQPGRPVWLEASYYWWHRDGFGAGWDSARRWWEVDGGLGSDWVAAVGGGGDALAARGVGAVHGVAWSSGKR
jgi:hypothetical protein